MCVGVWASGVCSERREKAMLCASKGREKAFASRTVYDVTDLGQFEIRALRRSWSGAHCLERSSRQCSEPLVRFRERGSRAPV